MAAKPLNANFSRGGRRSCRHRNHIAAKTDDAGVLAVNQKHIAAKAKMLMRDLARVGIIAMVDEATGYQEVRDKHAAARGRTLARGDVVLTGSLVASQWPARGKAVDVSIEGMGEAQVEFA
ncbi:MAG TPA: hypothetical protein VI113_05760 [Alphaproteobacteria bacterium]